MQKKVKTCKLKIIRVRVRGRVRVTFDIRVRACFMHIFNFCTTKSNFETVRNLGLTLTKNKWC